MEVCPARNALVSIVVPVRLSCFDQFASGLLAILYMKRDWGALEKPVEGGEMTP